MKKAILIFLFAIMIMSICGCGKANDDEVLSVPATEVTKSEQNEFVPFEVIKNDIGFVSEKGAVYYNSYLFNTSSRSITYELNGVIKYFLSYKNDLALLAVSGNQLFFRDIEENIIYRTELSEDVALSSGKMFFVYNGFASIISVGDNTLTLKTNDNKRIVLNTLNGELTELKAEYLAEFKPFDVSGDYFSFKGLENLNLITEGGIEIILQSSDDCDAIAYNKDGETIRLFENSAIVLDCIIDNSLYFIAGFYTESEALYRLELIESNGAITDTALSLVTDGYYGVIKGEKNQLIIRQGEAGSYYKFDTATAKMSNIKYNYADDAKQFESDIKISEKRAVDIALSECKKDKYFDMAPTPTDISVSGVEFLVDTAYPTGYRNGIVYEDYPWLVYRVSLNSFAYIVTVDINAQTGKPTFVSASFKD